MAITLLADRGFGNQVLYQHLAGRYVDYVIRFRECIQVTTPEGETRLASELVPSNGRARKIDDAMVTADRTPIGAVVCVKAAKMKDAWCLATSLKNSTAAEIVKLYGRRFTIEETFRDQKDMHFGMGLKATHIGKPERRDRMLLLGALAQTLLTMLGAAAEATVLDRLIKANTVKRRTHSLFRQGCFWYSAIPAMREDRLELLMNAFGKLIADQPAITQVSGVIRGDPSVRTRHVDAGDEVVHELLACRGSRADTVRFARGPKPELAAIHDRLAAGSASVRRRGEVPVGLSCVRPAAVRRVRDGVARVFPSKLALVPLAQPASNDAMARPMACEFERSIRPMYSVLGGHGGQSATRPWSKR